jgi:hypothetical protein
MHESFTENCVILPVKVFIFVVNVCILSPSLPPPSHTHLSRAHGNVCPILFNTAY